MRAEMLNGKPIPYDLPVEELKKLISSPVMNDFSLACEALSYNNTPEAYKIMKSYINDKDKYRRLYILKTIFRHPESAELVGLLEDALASDDFLFVSNGLHVVADYGIKVSESLLFSAVIRNLSNLYTEIRAINVLEVNEDNYIKLIEIFKKAESCSQKEFISDVFIEKYLPAKAKELFLLFGRDKFSKIRLCAVQIGKLYDFDIGQFLMDIDGHVRRAAEK